MFAVSNRFTNANARPSIARQMEEERARKAEIDRQQAEAAHLASIAQRRAAALQSIREANQALSRIRNGGGQAFMANIIRRICKVTGVSKAEIVSRRRNKEVVFARQAVMYWSVRLTSLTHPQIGQKLGGRDHTTVLHGVEAYRVKRAAKGRSLRNAR